MRNAEVRSTSHPRRARVGPVDRPAVEGASDGVGWRFGMSQ